MNYIQLAIPLFFVGMGIEVLLCRLKKKDYYRLNDTVADLSCGVVQQVLGVFLRTAITAAYLYIYEHHRVATLPEHALWAWVALFVGVDFFYYWFHRASHEVNFLWAIHVVHHQSEEYNLSVALRQAAFQQAVSWVFFLPLAWVGFTPVMFLTMLAFNTLYQFWIHTRLIGTLGPLEWVLNTPSHHRVHHGSNPRYIDRNHGGTLILWDLLFGTFQREEEEVVYGVTRPLRSFNPIWANFHAFADLYRESQGLPRLRDRLRVWFMPPGWQPGSGVHAQAPLPDKYDVQVSGRVKIYVALQYIPALLGATLLLFAANRLTWAQLSAGALAVGVTLLCLGGLCDRRRWAPPLEWVRVLGLGLLLMSYRLRA